MFLHVMITSQSYVDWLCNTLYHIISVILTHVELSFFFSRYGSETVLGEASDPLELFPIDECQDTYLASVNDNCSVIYKAPSPDWSMLGGIDDPETDHVIKEDDGKTFFYQKWYDPDLARFEDYELLSRPDDVPAHRFCSCCLKMERIQEVR